MNSRRVQLGVFMALAILFSSCGLKYSDQGRPFDFLKAKRYKTAKKELVQEDTGHKEMTGTEHQEPVEEIDEKTRPGVQSGINETESVDMPIWVYIILAIFIPPLAVGLYEGITGRWWLNLILTIIGWSGYFFSPIAYIASVLAVLHALFIVLEVI